MLATLLADGFDHHATSAAAFADALEAASRDEGALAAASPATLAEFNRIVSHVIGEHLGDWGRARRIAECATPHLARIGEAGQPWAHLFVVRLMSGDPAGALAAELRHIAASDRERGAALLEARFLLVGALVGSGRAADASPLYDAALLLADSLGDAAPDRAIAVASNNLATELLEAPERSAEATALMRRAAGASHAAWQRCGDWKHDERGHYLQALVANAVGEPEAALAHVKAALALIAANGEAPIDHAFLHLAKAQAHRLRGDARDAAGALAVSDAAAAAWEDPELTDWYAEERARMIGA